MKKINKSAELLWILGIILVALGVSICSKADLGVSMIAAPAFVVYDAIAPLWSGFSVGVTEYLIQGILLVLLCVVIRKFNWRYLLAFAVGVIYGYVLNFFLCIMSGITFDTVYVRWIMLIVGDIITAFGVACFFRTYMPLQVYELFVAELASRFGIGINKVKWAFDMSLLAASVSLAIILFAGKEKFELGAIGYSSFHSIGLGTLVTTAINSPIIAFMGKMLDRVFGGAPFFPRLKNVLERK